MARINLKVDLERDTQNYLACLNRTSYGRNWGELLPKDLLNAKPEKIREFLLKKYKKEDENVKGFIKSVLSHWNSIETKYFDCLKRITGKDLEDSFTVYITTVGRCPYDIKEKSFMICYPNNSDNACRIIAHELMHFNFYEFFATKCEKEIGGDKTADLKEALTFLLNLEFNGLWKAEDKGYPKHQKLREQLAVFWAENKDFNKLIDFGIALLRKP